jgi:peptide/nickel transport system permease protein
VFIVLVLVAVLPGHFTAYSPTAQALGQRLKPPGWVSQDGAVHALGTDQLGRDVWARIAGGARISLAVGIIGVGISAAVGVGVGVIAGFFGGRADMLIMRAVDIQLSFPFILLALVWAAFIGNTLPSIIIIVGIRGWADFARLVRAKVLALREQEFILATRALGASDLRLMLLHVVPNVLPLVLIVGSLQFGRAVILESTLSFLGLGIPPPAATWGGMLSDGRTYLGTAWWLTTIPGLAIMLMVLCANILGDALRDTFDPRMRL